MTRLQNRPNHVETGLAQRMPVAPSTGVGPEGAIIPDTSEHADSIAVVYDSGTPAPAITITTNNGVQTVHADGIAVAIIASAAGTDLCPADVVLVERFVIV
ncbi:hypothetical protein [Roseobacter sp.]|uniref:hypothetical protein n=1 Tax=Roseobacter sp. TaxID=1907202 RepID=UPI0032981871